MAQAAKKLPLDCSLRQELALPVFDAANACRCPSSPLISGQLHIVAISDSQGATAEEPSRQPQRRAIARQL